MQNCCENNYSSEIAGCNAAHAQRLNSCNSIQCTSFSNCESIECTSFTNCDSIECTSYTNCDSIQCTSFTNCNDYSRIDPRRYACWTARAACIAAKAVERAACWTARALCVAAKAVERAACWTARALCIAAKAVERAACWTERATCIAAAATTRAVCIAGSAVIFGVCTAAAWTKSAACKISILITDLLGPGPILSSMIRDVPSVPRSASFARSFILATDLRSIDLSSPYDEEGIHVEYRLVNGVVEWSVGLGANPIVFEPASIDLPSFAVPPAAGPLAVSYDRVRLGDWFQPPKFDMIAASGDRVIVKKEGTGEIFIAVTDNPYVHRVVANGLRLLLPQSYFKLDPEIGQPRAKAVDLLAHIIIPGDDERHPATERFSFFRSAFQLNLMPDWLPIPIGVQELGVMQAMDVRMVPRTWHKVDVRPPRGAVDPPSRYPSYAHVVYATKNSFCPTETCRSVRFERILDLGIGLSHLHEQHDHRFGGETDNLSSDLGLLKFLEKLTGITTSEEAYRFANGPIQDYGGWVDGTCIYYMLVQLKPDSAIESGDLKEAFAILWADEQFAFTERWRVLHIFDRDFASPFKPIVGLVTTISGDFYPDAPFDDRRFWCPFMEGHITPASRMAVTRQIIVINGVDPTTGRHELHSIHFTWPTMDKTWRVRPLPDGADILPSEEPDYEFGRAVVFADTLQIRDDTTILLRGVKWLHDEPVKGHWFQRYLPADGQEQPSVTDRATQAAFSKPSNTYTHPWDFVSDDAFPSMHKQFSHFGVYEAVRSRIQFYTLKLEQDWGLSESEIGQVVWEDREHKLKIDHERLDWAKLANILHRKFIIHLINFPGLILRMVKMRRSHPSVYNDPMAFKVVKRSGLGWILLHYDKRDDKVIGFDGLPLPGVVLTDRDNPVRQIIVTVERQLRNARDRHGRTVSEETDAVSPPQVRRATVTPTITPNGQVGTVTISFELARDPDAPHAYDSFATWVAMNIWRIKLGAIIAGRGVILLDVEREQIFTPNANGTTFTTVWTPPANHPHLAMLARLLTPEGRVRFGTSVWFVGATGMACCADETLFTTGMAPD